MAVWILILVLSGQATITTKPLTLDQCANAAAYAYKFGSLKEEGDAYCNSLKTDTLYYIGRTGKRVLQGHRSRW